ncbi:MAG: HEAT repeat domain-containing protein, partial [Planctomycetota bacterium]
KIRVLYTQLCSRIFSKTTFSDRLFSPYKSSYFQQTLREIFGEMTWGDLQALHPSMDLLLSLWDVSQQKPFTLNTKQSPSIPNFTLARIADILAASCATPFYFTPQVFAFQEKKSLYMDAKIGGKNILQSTLDALSSLSENLQLFSFGTESVPSDLSYENLRKQSASELPLHLLQATLNNNRSQEIESLDLASRIPSLNHYFQVTPVRHALKNAPAETWKSRLNDFQTGQIYGKIWNRDSVGEIQGNNSVGKTQVLASLPRDEETSVQIDGDPALIIPALFQAIEDQNLAKALKIAEILSQIEPLETELLEELLKKLHRAPYSVRKSLNVVFQQLSFGDKYTIGVVLQKILLNGSELCRREAACLCASLGSEKMVLELIHKLEDRDPLVRKHLCWSLGHLGKEAIRAIPALKEALIDSHEDVRKKASWALTQIAPYAPEEVIPYLMELLKQSSSALQYEAVWMLSETGLGSTPEKALPIFLDLLKKSGSTTSSLKIWIERALQKSISTAQILLSELQKTTSQLDKIHRKNAFWMLSLLEPLTLETIALFPPLLGEEDQELKALALSVLGKAQTIEMLPQFLKILQESEDSAFRIQTIQAIGAMGLKAHSATSLLLQMIKEGEMEERRVSAWALGKMRVTEAVPVLKQMLQEEEYFILSSAVFTLGGLNPDSERTAPTLLDALLREDYRSLRTAIVALGEIGDSAYLALPELIALLQNRNEYVREEAARTLGLIGKKATSAVPELILSLDDISERVRVKVAWALGEIGDRQAISALMKAGYGSSEFVRDQIEKALERLGRLSSGILQKIWIHAGLLPISSFADEFVFPSPSRSTLPLLASWALRPVWYKQYEWVLLLLFFASLLVLFYGVPLLYHIQ